MHRTRNEDVLDMDEPAQPFRFGIV